MGRPLPYLEELAENYWGASEIEHVIDELRKRDNVSWNIAMLTFMANLRVMKLDGMGISFREWKRRAAAQLNASDSEDFLDWYDEEDETYSRFNKRDGTLAVGNREGDVRTYFFLQKSKRKFVLPQEYLERVDRK